MSNPNKHKPLSPEELFKLLDDTSSKASDFDELDDFEREALEGFSAHSDSKKAQSLTEELNLAISQKASGIETKEGKKNKVIWFSAAASIVVVIMISVFFFNQSKEESQSNIVLNETKEDKQPVVSELGTVPPLETASANTISNNSSTPTDIAKREKEIAKILGVMAGPKKAAEENSESIATGATIGFSENKPALSPAVIVTKDEAKSGEGDLDALQKQTEVLSGKMDSKDKSKNINLEQEKSLSDMTVADDRAAANTTTQKVTTVASNTKGVKEEAYKADQEKSAKAKKSGEKQNVSKEQATVDAKAYDIAGYTKSESAPGQGSTTNNSNNSNNNEAANAAPISSMNTYSAYYVGSELAIRDVVLSYFTTKSLAIPVGKYKIKGTVDAKGKLKVSSVTKISKEDCKCVENIERALNTMKKWNPSNQSGKDVASNVEFVISF